MKIRLSPSGPIIGDAGAGFILERAFGNADIDPAFLVPLSTPIELKADPATATAPFVRPELTGVELDKAYTVEANLATLKSDTFEAANVNVFFDYSTDSGTSWNSLAWATFAVSAEGGPGDNQQWEVETDPVLGSAITGLIEGGNLMVRARLNQVGGLTETLRFNGTSTGLAAAGGFNLKLTKQLPA